MIPLTSICRPFAVVTDRPLENSLDAGKYDVHYFTSMLDAINLSKHYNGTVALDGLNLKIEQGEIFCLLGANSAGKTTTINLFLNFIAPTSGGQASMDLTWLTLLTFSAFAGER